uniref:hypothetical protein n=1 Tax=uncultured Sphingomonas sp. TaxID=158754 RepID=UPI0035CBD6D7
MTDQIEGPDYSMAQRRPTRKLSARTALIGAALLAVGVGGGATIAHLNAPSIEMAPVNPVAIRTLTDDGSVVSVRGKVAEVYGPMVVLADGSGRALVDLGRQGDGTGLVSAGQVVSVQGHYGRGLLHASFLVGADGKVTALRPMGPPHGGPGGRDGFRHGPRPGGPRGAGPDGGPDGGPDDADAPPPAPAPAAPAVTGNSAG